MPAKSTVKPWWQSSTIIGNALAIVATITAYVGFDLGEDFQGEIVALVLAAGNIFNRFRTTKAVE